MHFISNVKGGKKKNLTMMFNDLKQDLFAQQFKENNNLTHFLVLQYIAQSSTLTAYCPYLTELKEQVFFLSDLQTLRL